MWIPCPGSTSSGPIIIQSLLAKRRPLPWFPLTDEIIESYYDRCVVSERNLGQQNFSAIWQFNNDEDVIRVTTTVHSASIRWEPEGSYPQTAEDQLSQSDPLSVLKILPLRFQPWDSNLDSSQSPVVYTLMKLSRWSGAGAGLFLNSKKKKYYLKRKF